jgi:hypothetical protein
MQLLKAIIKASTSVLWVVSSVCWLTAAVLDSTHPTLAYQNVQTLYNGIAAFFAFAASFCQVLNDVIENCSHSHANLNGALGSIERLALVSRQPKAIEEACGLNLLENSDTDSVISD